MSIGCGQAFSMLGHSADIDFANTDSFLLGQLGIFAVPTYTTTSQRVLTEHPNPNVSAVYNVTQTFTGYEYFFSNISWVPQLQKQKLDENEVDRLRHNVNLLLRNEKCSKFIEN